MVVRRTLRGSNKLIFGGVRLWWGWRCFKYLGDWWHEEGKVRQAASDGVDGR